MMTVYLVYTINYAYNDKIFEICGIYESKKLMLEDFPDIDIKVNFFYETIKLNEKVECRIY